MTEQSTNDEAIIAQIREQLQNLAQGLDRIECLTAEWIDLENGQGIADNQNT